MSNILKVTTPPSGYDNNSVKTNPITTNDPSVHNIVDPSKVTRGDGRRDLSENNPDNKFGLNYESNFDKFLQTIKGMPQLSEAFTKLMFTQMQSVVSSGMGENIAEEISQFMEMIKMSDMDLLAFIKNQSSSSVRFKGVFFNALRQMLNETPSVELKTGILDFLKKYNDMTSGSHLLTNLEQNIKEILASIPSKARPPLEEMLSKLLLQAPNGETSANASILKGEIIPYLSKYIGRTHDFGRARDFISLLVLNTARYENGNKDAVMLAFKQIMSYNISQERLKGITPENLELILQNTDFEKASQNSSLADRLINIIQRGMKGEAGFENKQAFENIMKSVLMNESVYMPVMHMMIPADIDGRLLFSEMWVDPDADKNANGVDSERKIKLLIKFDIKDIGFFDVILSLQGAKVEMQLFYPEKLAEKEKEMKGELNNIMEKNGLSFKTLYIGAGQKPKTITEVFPQIYERKSTVNVSI